MLGLVWLQRASLDMAYTSLLLRPLWPKLSHVTPVCRGTGNGALQSVQGEQDTAGEHSSKAARTEQPVTQDYALYGSTHMKYGTG